MSDIAWVVLGLSIAYLSMAGYLASLEVRRRRLGDPGGRR